MNNNIGWQFDNSYTRLPDSLYARLNPVPVHAPHLAVLNEAASNGADTGAEMQKMASTLQQLNVSYESQLSGSQQQAETMQSMYAGITELMTNLSDSVEDTKKYKENISELSTNLSALNNVYGNMLTAMKS